MKPFLHITNSFIFFVLIIFSAGCGGNKEKKLKDAEQFLIEANMHKQNHKYMDALRMYDNALSSFKELELDSSVGEIYLMCADCDYIIGRYDSAIAYCRNATEVFQKINEKKLIRKSELAQSKFYLLLKEGTSASLLADNVLGTAEIFSDQEDISSALNILAEANHKLGKYEKELYAIERLIKIDSLQYSSKNKNQLLERKLLAYEANGRRDLACVVFDKWKSYAESTNNDTALVQLYYIWGLLQRLSNHADSALRSFSQALGKMDRQMDRGLQADILSSLGCLAYRSRHFEDARRYFADAVSISSQNNDVVRERFLKLMLIASDWKFSGGKTVALAPEFVKRCESIFSACQQDGLRVCEAFALFLQARILEQSGKIDEAIPFYSQALQVYEQVSHPFANESIEKEIIDAFMDGEKSGWYDPLLRYYCTQIKGNEVFDIVERENLSDIRQFFSQLTIKTSNEKLNQAISTLQRKCRELAVLEEDIQSEISLGKKMNSEHLQLLKDIFEQRRSDLISISDNLGALNPNFRWMLASQTPTLKQIQYELQPKDVLVRFIPLSDVIYVLAISRDTSYIFRSVVDRERVLSLVKEYNRLLSDPTLNTDSAVLNETALIKRIDELSKLLGGILVEPILPILNNITKMYIVSPIEFGWLPFHTLKAGEAPIIERFEISYLPAAAALLFSFIKEDNVRKVIGIGHPGRTGWDVEYELKDIRSFYEDAKMLFNESADLKYLDTATYDDLHFTAEFTLDTKVPDNSVFLLSDGKTSYGFDEISLGKTLHFSPPKVLVFSNISSTAGGFFRYAPLAFLANGTPTVIATMWQGERKAKKYFGEMFYTSLKAGLPASQAYHDAVVASSKNPEINKAYKWGLFYGFGK